MTGTQRRLEKQAEAARARYAKTRSFVALQRMKDAVTKALAASLRSGETEAKGVRQ